MKSHKFILLFVITLITVIAAVILTYRQSPTVNRDKTVLFPEFIDRINDISEITVQNKKDTLTVVNDNGAWKIREADDYPALFNKVKQTAIAVSELKIISEKTSNPGLYSELGVEDPASAEAGSMLLTLKDAGGNSLVSLIVGKNRLSRSASENPGLYVRLPEDKQSLLVEGSLDVSTDVADWIERNLMDIKPERIKHINIMHPDDEDVILDRDNDSGDLVVQNVPEGKQARSDYILNRLEGILEDIRIDNVKAESALVYPDDAVVATVMTSDGLSAEITSAVIDEKNYARFDFNYVEPPQANNPEAEPDEVAGTEGRDEEETGETHDVGREVADLRALTEGWVYQLPSYKFETFTRKLDDLVEDIPEEEEEQEEAVE